MAGTTEGGSTAARFARAWASCILVAAVIVPVLVVQPWRTYLDEGPIRSDGLGYFAWTRAALDGTLDFCRYPAVERAAVVRVPRPTRGDPDAFRCANRYPPGLAILQFPVMAALADHGDQPEVVTTGQHKASLWLGGIALMVLCVAIVATARRLGAQGWGVHVAVLVFVFGAGLFPYATYAASYAHVHEAMLVAILLWVGVRTRQEGRRAGLALLGAVAAFFLIAIRNVDLVVLGVLVAGYLCWTWRAREEDSVRDRARGVVLDVLPVLVGAAVACAFQLLLNHHVSGRWTLSSYGGGEDFAFDHPMQRSVLFSYNRGLFVYSPVVLLTVVLGLAVARSRAWAALYVALIALLATVYGFWFQWQLGGGAGFGHRGFVDVAPVGMLVAAVALPALSRVGRIAVGGLAVVCALWSLQLTLMMWNYEFPEYTVTPSVYWSHTVGEDSLWLSWLP